MWILGYAANAKYDYVVNSLYILSYGDKYFNLMWKLYFYVRYNVWHFIENGL